MKAKVVRATASNLVTRLSFRSLSKPTDRPCCHKTVRCHTLLSHSCGVVSQRCHTSPPQTHKTSTPEVQAHKTSTPEAGSSHGCTVSRSDHYQSESQQYSRNLCSVLCTVGVLLTCLVMMTHMNCRLRKLEEALIVAQSASPRMSTFHSMEALQVTFILNS